MEYRQNRSDMMESLFNAVKVIADKSVQAYKQDVTIDGEINEIKNIENGEYKILYQGNIFSAFSSDPLITYKKGERVYILVPQGDYSAKKIIIGRSSYQNNDTYKSRQAMTNFFVEQGPDWTEWYSLQTPMMICSKPDASRATAITDGHYMDYGFTRAQSEGHCEFNDDSSDPDYRTAHPENRYWVPAMTAAELKESDAMLEKWSLNHEYIKIQATFKTRFAGAHTKGSYALVLRCREKNPLYLNPEDPGYDDAQKPYNIVEYKLGFTSFTGAPYSYTVPSTQYAYFSVPMGSILGLESLSLQQDGEMEVDIPMTINEDGSITYDMLKADYTNNIFVEDIKIHFANKVNLSDTLYYPWISTPYGTSLYHASAGRFENERLSVTLIPHLQYGDTDLLEGENTSELCEVHWFRKKAEITQSSASGAEKDKHRKTWFDYGGAGWYPIENFIKEQGGDPADAVYELDGNNLIIKIDAVPFQYEYKAVICYLESEEVNGTTQYKELNRSEVYQVVERLDSAYDLSIEQSISDDNRSIYLEVINKNKDSRDIYDHYPEWFALWFVERQDGSYASINNPAVGGNDAIQGKIEITPFLKNDVVTFYALAMDPEVVDPDNDGKANFFREATILTKIIKRADSGDVTVSWTGKDSFNYDALGGLVNDLDKNEHVLTPNLNWLEGKGSNYIVRYYFGQGEYIVPLGDREWTKVQAEQQGFDGSGSGYSPEDSMMKNMWADISGNIHFSIYETFDEFRKNNFFTIQVSTYDGNTFTATKEIIFTKDGNDGTIGNEWKAQVRRCSDGKLDGVKYEDKFITQVANPLPMIVRKVDDHYESDIRYPVYLRPFVTRRGTAIEKLDPYEGYFYRAYWDVRMPASAAKENVRYASFLRLYHAYTDRFGAAAEIFDTERGGTWETGGPKTGDTLESIRVNENEVNRKGLVGYTQYPYYVSAGVPVGATETYGAVEVRFFDNLNFGTGSTMAQHMYRFIVKCQVDIMRGQYQQDNMKIAIDGDTERIASITTYYPIDVFFNEEDINIDAAYPKFRDYMYTNWPNYIQYDARGYNPTQMHDPLIFKFGSKYDAEIINYPAHNLTPTTQTIEEIHHYNVKYKSKALTLNLRKADLKDMPDTYTGAEAISPGFYKAICSLEKTYHDKFELNETTGKYTLLATLLPSERLMIVNNVKDMIGILKNDEYYYYDQMYKAKPHLTMAEGFSGAIALMPGTGPFGRNWLVRPQVMLLNLYGNVDVNGWDGQGLSTNEKEGTIFGATFGAGYKRPSTNAFTGILMGADKSQPRDNMGGQNFYADAEAVKNMPYLTGLFGYQEGVQSFGLMENGTAFFGRADRGGRIIFDGSNGTIYGGANGALGSPKIGDPMWNTMRLNLVDLTHATMGYEYQQENLESQIWPTDYNPTGFDETDKKVLAVGVKNGDRDTVVMGFDGNFFGYNDDEETASVETNKLPFWYGKLWKNAYIKPDGQLPYWLQYKPDGNVIGYDDETLAGDPLVPAWDGKDPRLLVGETNYKVNYFNEHRVYFNFDVGQGWKWYIYEDLDKDFSAEGGTNYKNYKGTGKSYRQVYDEARLGKGELAEMQTLFEDANPISSFGPSRASTTPAIEIGQHVHGLMPGLLDYDDYEMVFRTLQIPGDRNFMVTYDGTMWAMNGVFMGAVIGSNIIGGRMQGVELAIGDKSLVDPDDEAMSMFGKGASIFCDWGANIPPKNGAYKILEMFPSGSPFEVDRVGAVKANSIEITGGCISIGTFNILGKETFTRDYKLKNANRVKYKIPEIETENWGRDFKDEYGHLYQFGKSDFMGLTHFYGNVGVGPSFLAETGQNMGNITQTRGVVAFGITSDVGSSDTSDLYKFWSDNTKMPSGERKSTAGNMRVRMMQDIWNYYFLDYDPYNIGGMDYAEPYTYGIYEYRPGILTILYKHYGDTSKLNDNQKEAYRLLHGTFHEDIANRLTGDTRYDVFGTNQTSPKLKELEQKAFFVTDNREGNGDARYEGHFWPMHHHANDERTLSWFTTMDLFESLNTGYAGNTLHTNYFRVSPFGTESTVIYIRNFQGEHSLLKPTNSEYGYIGKVLSGIGIMGGASRDVTIRAGSNNNIGLYTSNQIELVGGNPWKEGIDSSGDAVFVVNNQYGNSTGGIYGLTSGGNIGLATLKGGTPSTQQSAYIDELKSAPGGLLISGSGPSGGGKHSNPGTYLWADGSNGPDSGIHVFASYNGPDGPDCQEGQKYSELMLNKQGAFLVGYDRAFCVCSRTSKPNGHVVDRLEGYDFGIIMTRNDPCKALTEINGNECHMYCLNSNEGSHPFGGSNSPASICLKNTGEAWFKAKTAQYIGVGGGAHEFNTDSDTGIRIKKDQIYMITEGYHDGSAFSLSKNGGLSYTVKDPQNKFYFNTNGFGVDLPNLSGGYKFLLDDTRGCMYEGPKGGFKFGADGYVTFSDDYANPEHQKGIYARFAG